MIISSCDFNHSFAPGQVVELDQDYRERVHKYQLHNYFYGHVIEPPPGLSTKAYVQGGEQTPDLILHLSPSSTTVNFGDITIYRIGEGGLLPVSALVDVLLKDSVLQRRWLRTLPFP